MTQGAGQGPDVWHDGATTGGTGTARTLSPAQTAPGAPVAAPQPGTPGLPVDTTGPQADRTPPVAPGGPLSALRAGGPAPAPVHHDPRPAADPALRAAPPTPGADPLTAAAPPPPPAPGGPEPVAPGPAPAAPGAPGPVEGMPEEYTPTARDLPVIGAAAAVPEGREPTMVDVPAAATSGNEGDGPLYVVGDVHGYLDELRAALRQFGIIDADNKWIAGNARLWFLGDFTDRGPDGIGVIELVMQLSAEAAAAGGYCKALMGNHELLLLGAKRFGDTPVNSGAGTASFQAAWLLNGGQRTDMERLADHHVQWMSRLDAMALADNHLLVHSDASCYLDYGSTIEDVNDAITEALQRNDAEETWELFRKFTKRFAFREETAGPAAVRDMLDTFGGKRIVHGHSPIPYLLGEVDSEDGESAPNVTGPHVYADGLAIAMDGGVTMGAKLLIAQLPLVQ
ncbi:metallophosphoesterase family protein [Streptomyces sp. GSL17-113]|uniref:metallophosphoesterase family protein n=1 Tax=Streptomyces sp. GSL17-113 TaxID=3115365 RepID=UPI002E76AC62|nr:metallophosphoesterase [Streptomyces sp. GSL17-113]